MQCKNCNVEMIEGKLVGQHPFSESYDKRTEIHIEVKTGEKKSFLGLPYEETYNLYPKAYVCPKCTKVELYAQPKKI